MTDFENKMLHELLKMKEQELLLLSSDNDCGLKNDEVEKLAIKCRDLSSEIFYVDTKKTIV